MEDNFYRDHSHHVLIGLMMLMLLMMVSIGGVLYMILSRPLPVFTAVQPNNMQMQLTPFEEPNLLPATILRWATKAAAVAYTFDFEHYRDQLAAARPYFTEAGWNGYLVGVGDVLNTVVDNHLFVNGVVSGTPVISNQGDLPGKGYTWRIQIPFLVTYQASNSVVNRNFYVILTIVRVPTRINPQGVGIDQFVMVGTG